MRLTPKVSGLVATLLISLHIEARAQETGSLVSSFSNILIGVSALLVAVGFVMVLFKIGRLIDLISARYESPKPPSKQ